MKKSNDNSSFLSGLMPLLAAGIVAAGALWLYAEFWRPTPEEVALETARNLEFVERFYANLCPEGYDPHLILEGRQLGVMCPLLQSIVEMDFDAPDDVVEAVRDKFGAYGSQ